MEFRTITEGLEFPEGPVALADGSVLLVEIAAGTLTRVAPDGTKTVVARTGGGPNGAAIGADGKCYICNNGGFEWHREAGRIRPLVQAKDYSGGRIERVHLETGTVEVLYRTCGDIPLKGPNDLVFDAHGGIYFTDLGKRRVRDMDIGAVYYAKADGSFITEVAHPMMTPNGRSRSRRPASSRRSRGHRRMAAGWSPVWAAISASTRWRCRPTGGSASPPWSMAASP
jgi:gluconolactonase